jgi:hypothetical protein
MSPDLILMVQSYFISADFHGQAEVIYKMNPDFTSVVQSCIISLHTIDKRKLHKLFVFQFD